MVATCPPLDENSNFLPLTRPKATVTLSRLTNTAVSVDPRASNRKGCIIKRDRTYNKKGYAGRNTLKKATLFLLKHYVGHKAFVTITTCQNYKNKYGISGERFSDAQAIEIMGNLLRSKKYFGAEYTMVCERQRDTGDLHFHICMHTADRNFIDWKKLRAKTAKAFGIQDLPPVLQFDWLTTENAKELIPRYMSKVSGYISKESASKKARLNPEPMQSYVLCDGDKFNGSPYSSIFNCRTFSVSKSLRSEFRRVADRYELKVDTHIANTFLKTQIHSNDFYSVYKSNDEIFNKAKRAVEEAAAPSGSQGIAENDGRRIERNLHLHATSGLGMPNNSEKSNKKISEQPRGENYWNPNSAGEARSLKFWQNQKINNYENCIQSSNCGACDSRFINRKPIRIGIEFTTSLGKHLDGRRWGRTCVQHVNLLNV